MFSILSGMDRWTDEWWTVRHEMKQTADPEVLRWKGDDSQVLFRLLPLLSAIPLPVPLNQEPVWVSEPQLGWLRCRGRRAQLKESKVAFLHLLLFLFNQIAKIKFIKKGGLNVLKALIPLSVTQSCAMPHESPYT